MLNSQYWQQVGKTEIENVVFGFKLNEKSSSLDSIAVSVFVVILVEFDKY